MSAEKAVILLIKGAISELSPEEQAKVAERADQIRDLVKDDVGSIAIALVGAEMAAAEADS